MRNWRGTFCITFLLTSLFFYSNAADTLKIHLTYKHKLNDSGQTTGYTTIKQQFFLPDGTLFREVNYNESTNQIESYVFFFYRGGKLFTEECYNAKDSLQYIVKHEYDAGGNEISVTRLVPGIKNLDPVEKSDMTYNNHKVLRVKKYFGKKTGGSVQYKYNTSGLPVQEKIMNKPVAKADFAREIRDFSCSPDGKIIRVKTTGKDSAGKPYQFTEEYSYNAAGLISSIKKLSADGSPAGERVFKYLNAGTPSIYEEHDANGKLTLLLQYDYKKHFMERGTQVSYYENL